MPVWLHKNNTTKNRFDKMKIKVHMCLRVE